MLSVSQIVDTELLRAFVAFADERNFTRAAKTIGLSQPAFFERIKKLSELVGCALYERDGGTLNLTNAGVKTAAFAREQLQNCERFLSEIRGEAKREWVTLAAGEGAYLYVIGEAVRGFVKENTARLNALTLGGPSAVTAVLEGAAQLAVGVVDLVPRGVQTHELMRCSMMAAMSASHPLARKREIKLSELAGQSLILPPEGQSHRAFVGRAMASVGVHLEQTVEADGWPLLLHFASLGLGVAVVNSVCVAPKGVVLRKIPELGRVSYRVFTRKNEKLSAPAEDLLRRLVSVQK